MRRPTKAIVEARTVEIFRIMLDGGEAHDLREYVHEQNASNESIWYVGGRKLSHSQIYRYSQRAWRMIAETCRSSRKRLMRKHLAQRRNLIAKSIAAGDLRTALAAMESEARLLRLHDEPSRPAPKVDALPAGTADIVRVLAARLKEIEESKLPASERVRLTATLADSLLRAISVETIDKKAEELAARLDELTNTKK